ncbi:MAG: hypothetical protein U9Q99_03030 [Nanoarchaeota archaeon]|nr:hypothetical protein [Nanoarchaeota archaeon]
MKQSIIKAAKSIINFLPLIIGTILLISLISIIIPREFLLSIFKNNFILDPFLGSIFGSISAGNPVISYIFAGEFLKQGISLIAVTAFIVSWVTVGIIQIPAESAILGKKFTLIRNISAFILAIIVAIITILILKII